MSKRKGNGKKVIGGLVFGTALFLLLRRAFKQDDAPATAPVQQQVQRTQLVENMTHAPLPGTLQTNTTNTLSLIK
jgi:hypothetical protein